MTDYLPEKRLFTSQTLWYFLLLFAIPQVGNSQGSFNSSNLPILVIDTGGSLIYDEPKVTARMSVINNGEGMINHLTDSVNGYQGPIGIEFRGASSQYFYPKKSYGIEIRTEAGEEKDASLLGMPKESDWVLYAPYGDKSLVRDVLTYQIGRQLGGYAPRTAFCELVLNGEYQGVYVLIEKVKRNKNRVNIHKLDSADIAGDKLTGGYLLKIDKAAGNVAEGWASLLPSAAGSRTYFQYEYPKTGNIAAEQKQYIQKFMNDFEAALYGSDFTDAAHGYSQYLDVASFVDYLIVTELSKNVDGYRLSFFMYKDRDSEGGKLHAGPLWDYNLGYGNANYCLGESTSGFAMDFDQNCPLDDAQPPFWWRKLSTDPAFNTQVISRWQALRQSVLKTETLMSTIDAYAQQLQEAQARNFVRWPILGTYVWPNYVVGNTYAEEINYLKTWLTNRLAWLDSNIGIVTAVEENSVPEVKFQAWPNPFTTSVHLQYSLQQSGPVSIKIDNLLGQPLITLTDLPKATSRHEFQWDGCDATGNEVPVGIYFCTLEKEGKILARYKLYKLP